MRETASDRRQWLIIVLCCLFCVGLVLLPIIALAQSQPGVRLYGYLTDAATRAPVAGAYLDIGDETGTRLTDATTGANGYYDVTARAAKLYSVGISVWVQNGEYQVHRYIPTTVNIDPAGAAAIHTDVALQPGTNLILNLYGTDGQLLRNRSYGDATGDPTWESGRTYVTDLDDMPCGGRPWAVQDSYAAGRGWDYTVPAFVIPPRTPVRIHVLWEVPGYGRILLDADNDGKGYQIAAPGGYLVLDNFPYEAAKYATASLRTDSAAFKNKGYSIPASISNGIQTSGDHLVAAEGYLAQTPQALTQASTELYLALRDALLTHEGLVLELARNDIRQARMGTVRVGVHDWRRQPLAGATVVYKQTNSDFLIGANPLGSNMHLNPRQVALIREAGFNHSYVFAPWETLEPSPGSFQWDAIDSSQDIWGQLNRGFTLMGGLALWLNRGAGIGGTQYCPAYLDKMTFADLQRNAQEHMRAMAARYKGRIDLWEINEQNLSWANVLKLTWDQKIELYRAAITGLREGNPDAKTIFTSTALPYEFRPGMLAETSAQAGGIAFPDFLKLIMARGIPVDVIGLEFYYTGVNTDNYAPPGLSLVQFSKLLDRYSAFGKPLFFREFTAPSVQAPRSSWWHRHWDEATQADFASSVFNIAFSKSLVRQIGWSYGVSDDDSFILGGGLLDANWNPKPAYTALKQQFAAWTSSGTGQTDANGTFLFSGYAGDYELTITAPGGSSWQEHVNVGEGQSTEVMTAPDAASPASLLRSADVARYQESRNGSWFSENLFVMPSAQTDPDLVFDVKGSAVSNRKNGQISPTLLATYLFIQQPSRLADFTPHIHTTKALFLRSDLHFVDYLNNRIWLTDNTAGTLPADIEGLVRLCNDNQVPVFLEVNYSDYIPGPIGSSGLGSLELADNAANTISFLQRLADRGLRLEGITFGNQILDDNGWGAYKPTLLNSDLADRFVRYARAIKSKFPGVKVYAFASGLGEVYGLLSANLCNGGPLQACWSLLDKVHQAELEAGMVLIDGFGFTESYVYIDKGGNLLDSQLILDDTESLYRFTPIYRFAIMGESYPNPESAYFPYIVNRITGIFGRPLDFALTEYLPAGPVQISESDTTRYSDMDFILHFSDVIGISATLGIDVVSRIMFAGPTQHKTYVDSQGNPGVNYPVQEQLAAYFGGELLEVGRTRDYDDLKVKLYATRMGGRYFLLILNKEVRREATLRITLPGDRIESRVRRAATVTRGTDMTIRVPRRSYTSLIIEDGKIVISGIGN